MCTRVYTPKNMPLPATIDVDGFVHMYTRPRLYTHAMLRMAPPRSAHRNPVQFEGKQPLAVVRQHFFTAIEKTQNHSFPPGGKKHMARKTIAQHEAELAELEAAMRYRIHEAKNDDTLTPKGVTERVQNWGKQERWAERLAEHSTAILGALEGVKNTAATRRAELVALPEGDAALASELRFMRRRGRIDAAIESGGAGAVQRLLAEAKPEDLPTLAEHVIDGYEAKGGTTAGAGAQLVEQELRARSPEYDTAARTAARAANGATFARAKLDYLQRLAGDPDTPVPADWALESKPIATAGDELGELET